MGGVGGFWVDFGWSLGVLLSGFLSRFLSGFLDFFVGHNLLMTIDNLLILKKFWGILPLLNYF